jgi:ribosomal protein L4
MARKALAIVLSAKFREQEIIFVEDGVFKDHKTKNAVSLLKALGGIKEFPKLGFSGGRALILTSQYDTNSIRALRNLQTVGVKPALMAQVHETLSYKYIVIPKGVIEVLKKKLRSNK